MIIEYKGVSALSVCIADSSLPGSSPCAIFRTGLNDLPDAVWERVKKNVLVSKMLSSGIMSESNQAKDQKMHVAFKVSISSKRK